jgi:hypothetical protein
MKLVMFACCLAAAALSIGACSTIDMSTYEDENIYAELEMNNPRQVTLTLDNRSQGELVLDQTRVYYSYNNQEAPLTPVTETESGADVPPMRVPPAARKSQNFALDQAVALKDGKRDISEWLPQDTSGVGVRFVYLIDEEERPLVFPDPQERALVGKVRVSLDIAVPFLSSVIDRRRKIYDLAFAQAKSSFGAGGKQLRLVNLHYDSKTNGFVENAVLTADVIAAGDQ